jgi:hypothetical protein
MTTLMTMGAGVVYHVGRPSRKVASSSALPVKRKTPLYTIASSARLYSAGIRSRIQHAALMGVSCLCRLHHCTLRRVTMLSIEKIHKLKYQASGMFRDSTVERGKPAECYHAEEIVSFLLEKIASIMDNQEGGTPC